MKTVEIMARPARKQISIGSSVDQQIEKQNIRTLMQALHGCRKNCRECKEEETE